MAQSLIERLLYARSCPYRNRSDESWFPRSSQATNKYLPYWVEVWGLRGDSNCCVLGLMGRARVSKVSWKNGYHSSEGRAGRAGLPYGGISQSVLSPLPMLSPTVVVAPAKPRSPERRAEAKVPWRLGQDQAVVRGGRCYHVNSDSQPTNQPSWGPCV